MAKPKLNLSNFTGVMSNATATVKPDTELDLAQIYTTVQVRKTFEGLSELADTIKLNGIIQPLIVHEETDGRFRLIVGERRLRAAPLAGLVKVPVLIKRGLTELEIRAIQVTENNDREDLTAFEEAQGVIEDIERFGFAEAVKIWNHSEGWLSKRQATNAYATPVRELLEQDLCGDFEILHCLNQIHKLDKNGSEFNRLNDRLRDGGFISRDEARNLVSRMKTHLEQQKEQAKRRHLLEKEETQATAKHATDDQHAALEKTVNDTGSKVTNAKGSKAPPAADAKKPRAAKQQLINSLRNELFEWGETNLAQFNRLTENLREADYTLNEGEWVLWSGFLSTTLPMLHALGSDRANSYLKRLQAELKRQEPMALWEQQHPAVENSEDSARVIVPDMPDKWHI